MSTTFQLHSRLQEDCIELGRFELCRLLLMNDNQYPWFILVPEVEEGVREVFQLSRAQRELLNEESCYLAEQLAKLYHADKMNVAVIGNIVPQLHVHHIVRYRHDKAWPAPVWGKFPAIPYSQEQIAQIRCSLDAHLKINSA